MDVDHGEPPLIWGTILYSQIGAQIASGYRWYNRGMTEWGSKTDRMNVRMTPDLKRLVTLLAAEFDATPSDMACRLIEAGAGAVRQQLAPERREALAVLTQSPNTSPSVPKRKGQGS